MIGIGITELLILLAIPVLGLVCLAIVFFVVRAATKSGNRHDMHE